MSYYCFLSLSRTLSCSLVRKVVPRGRLADNYSRSLAPVDSESNEASMLAGSRCLSRARCKTSWEEFN